MVKDRDGRYQDATEFRADLARARTGEPISAAASAPQRPACFRRRGTTPMVASCRTPARGQRQTQATPVCRLADTAPLPTSRAEARARRDAPTIAVNRLADRPTEAAAHGIRALGIGAALRAGARHRADPGILRDPGLTLVEVRYWPGRPRTRPAPPYG
ncbi:MAG: hypothetical protein IPL93_16125 [Actinomycetales bacterium]|nr:hypothetical protein [Actinomycetales bacterium]